MWSVTSWFPRAQMALSRHFPRRPRHPGRSAPRDRTPRSVSCDIPLPLWAAPESPSVASQCLCSRSTPADSADRRSQRLIERPRANTTGFAQMLDTHLGKRLKHFNWVQSSRSQPLLLLQFLFLQRKHRTMYCVLNIRAW